MKAERRHQLQDNTLAKGLETAPEWLMRNASKIMLVITACLLAWFIVRYRANANQQKMSTLGESMLNAREKVARLRAYDLQAWNPQEIARNRAQTAGEVNTAIENVLTQADGTDDAPYRAEALLSRGDLNWSLANLMPLPGATTQPILQLPRSSEAYLKEAENAYNDVVTVYSQQMVAWVSAEMGLAAIAENRRDWDAARKAYGAIIGRPDVPPGFVQVAENQVRTLPVIAAPMLLSAYPPATQPATQAGTQAWPPSSQVVPATQPVSAPAGPPGDSSSPPATKP